MERTPAKVFFVMIKKSLPQMGPVSSQGGFGGRGGGWTGRDGQAGQAGAILVQGGQAGQVGLMLGPGGQGGQGGLVMVRDKLSEGCTAV